MLKKVIKYEFRAAGRFMAPLLLAAVAVTALLRLLHLVLGLVPTVQSVATVALSVVGMVGWNAVSLLALIAMVVRFYQSMAGREAYLTFTLPVKPTTHLWGRTFVAMVYLVAANLVALGMLLVLAPDTVGAIAEYLKNPTASFTLTSATETIEIPLASGQIGTFFAVAGVLALVSLFSGLFQYYASIALGAGLMKNRALGGVMAYLILSTVEGAVTVPLLLVPLVLVIGFTPAQWAAFFEKWFSGTPEQVSSSLMAFLWILLAVIVVLNALYTLVHYIIIKRQFTQKLNLD